MESKKYETMKGNTNAQKSDEPADSFLHIRIARDKKASYMRQAQSEGKKLSEWVQEKLDAVVS